MQEMNAADGIEKKHFPKVKICISGAADTTYCGDSSFVVAEGLGREIAEHGAVLVDGATTGFPFWAAKGAKLAGGIVVGISPASTEKEHIEVYKLPIAYHDLIIYTGAGYSGRNLLLTRTADAVIEGCGRMGTINEFTIAFEDRKPIGIMEGEWGTDEVIKMLIEKSHRAEEMAGKIIYAKDPKEMVENLLVVIEKYKADSERRVL